MVLILMWAYERRDHRASASSSGCVILLLVILLATRKSSRTKNKYRVVSWFNDKRGMMFLACSVYCLLSDISSISLIYINHYNNV